MASTAFVCALRKAASASVPINIFKVLLTFLFIVFFFKFLTISVAVERAYEWIDTIEDQTNKEISDSFESVADVEGSRRDSILYYMIETFYST